MSLYPSVLRRYTPPTCTLEIHARKSALSSWTDRPVFKNLRFLLRFDDPRLPNEHHVQLQGNLTQLEALHTAVTTYIQEFLEQTPNPKGSAQTIADSGVANSQLGSSQKSDKTPDSIYLQSRGLVSHDLFLGTLATAASGAAICLSALQLFDLATALDTFATDALSLPELGTAPNWRSSVWLRAAAVVVVAAGLTTAVVKLSDRPAAQVAVSNRPQADPFSQTQPASRQPFPSVTPQTKPTAPLTSKEKLPPVPSPTTTAQSADEARSPVSSQPSTTTATTSSKGEERPSSPVITPTPVRKLTLPPIAKSEPTSPSPSSPIPESEQPVPLNDAAPEPNDLAAEQQRTIAAAPRFRQPAAIAPTNSNSAPMDANGAPVGRAATSRVAANSPSVSSFDLIPQVAEARQYFQQRWTPPEGLTQTLEYQLTLNSNGSIQKIAPLGYASRRYVDRTSIPLVGEPFVSPIETGETVILRLVLSPNGNVQTLMESP